jgi:GNAT superfamily N-acetyltransferase
MKVRRPTKQKVFYTLFKVSDRVDNLILNKLKSSIDGLMIECFGSKDTLPSNMHIYNESDLWLLGFHKKTNYLISCLLIEQTKTENKIWNVCVSKEHRGNGYGKVLMKQVIHKLPLIGNNNPVILYVKFLHQLPDYGLIEFYQKSGFQVIKHDEQNEWTKMVQEIR